jgi:hypothetical protein
MAKFEGFEVEEGFEFEPAEPTPTLGEALIPATAAEPAPEAPVAPEEEAVRPTLAEFVPPPEQGIKTLQFIGDILGFPTRLVSASIRKGEADPLKGGLGLVGGAFFDLAKAAVNPEKAKAFLKELADPEGGVFKEVRENIAESDQPGFLKFVETIAVAAAEDPVTWVTGVGGLLRATGRAVARKAPAAAAREAPEAGVKISREVAERAAVRPELKVPVPERVDIPFTPAEELKVTGKPIPKRLAKKEIAARKQTQETVIKLQKAREELITENIKSARKELGVENINNELLNEEFQAGIEGAVGRFRARSGKLYENINNIADVDVIPEATKAVRNSIDDLIKPTLIKTAEIREVAGDLGLSPRTFNLMIATRNRLAKDITFKQLKNRRSNIGKTLSDIKSKQIPSGTNDSKALGELYENLTNSMKTHLTNKFGKEVADEWVAADRFFGETVGGFRNAQKLFFKATGAQRNTQEVIKEFARVPTPKKGTILDQMEDFMDEGTIKTFRNLYFNEIVEKATKKGVVNPQDLVKVLNKQPSSIFTKVFDDGMRAKIGDVVAEAMADDFARELKLVGKNPRALLDKLSSTTNRAYRWWLIGQGLGRFGVSGVKVAAGTAATAAVSIANSLRRGRAAKKAADFLLQIDRKSTIPILFKPITVPVTAAAKVPGPVGRAAEIAGRPAPPEVPEEEPTEFEGFEL